MAASGRIGAAEAKGRGALRERGTGALREPRIAEWLDETAQNGDEDAQFQFKGRGRTLGGGGAAPDGSPRAHGGGANSVPRDPLRSGGGVERALAARDEEEGARVEPMAAAGGAAMTKSVEPRAANRKPLVWHEGGTAEADRGVGGSEGGRGGGGLRRSPRVREGAANLATGAHPFTTPSEHPPLLNPLQQVSTAARKARDKEEEKRMEAEAARRRTREHAAKQAELRARADEAGKMSAPSGARSPAAASETQRRAWQGVEKEAEEARKAARARRFEADAKKPPPPAPKFQAGPGGARRTVHGGNVVKSDKGEALEALVRRKRMAGGEVSAALQKAWNAEKQRRRREKAKAGASGGHAEGGGDGGDEDEKEEEEDAEGGAPVSSQGSAGRGDGEEAEGGGENNENNTPATAPAAAVSKSYTYAASVNLDGLQPQVTDQYLKVLKAEDKVKRRVGKDNKPLKRTKARPDPMHDMEWGDGRDNKTELSQKALELIGGMKPNSTSVWCWQETHLTKEKAEIILELLKRYEIEGVFTYTKANSESKKRKKGELAGVMTIWLKTVWSIVGKPVHDYPGRVMTVTLRNNVDKTDTTFCNVYLPTAQSYSKEHKHEVGSAVVASATMHKEGGAFYACGDFNGPPKHMVKGAVDENTRTVMRLTEELSMKRLHNDLPTYFYTPAKSKASKMATDWEVAKEMAAKAVSVKAAAPGKNTAVSVIIGRTVLIPCTLIDTRTAATRWTACLWR